MVFCFAVPCLLLEAGVVESSVCALLWMLSQWVNVAHAGMTASPQGWTVSSHQSGVDGIAATIGSLLQPVHYSVDSVSVKTWKTMRSYTGHARTHSRIVYVAPLTNMVFQI